MARRVPMKITARVCPADDWKSVWRSEWCDFHFCTMNTGHRIRTENWKNFPLPTADISQSQHTSTSRFSLSRVVRYTWNARILIFFTPQKSRTDPYGTKSYKIRACPFAKHIIFPQFLVETFFFSHSYYPHNYFKFWVLPVDYDRIFPPPFCGEKILKICSKLAKNRICLHQVQYPYEKSQFFVHGRKKPYWT